MKMKKDVDRGDFYNTYNFMSITSFMRFIGYTGYMLGRGGWGGGRKEKDRGTACILPRIHNTSIMFCCPKWYIHT